MSLEPTAKYYNALYPEEILKRYSAGERTFVNINLLRKELESIMGETIETAIVAPGYVSEKSSNPLWLDFLNLVPSDLPGSQQFDWDRYGRFGHEGLDEIPEKDLSNTNLSNINLAGSYLYPVNFSNTDLSHANLQHTKLLDVNLGGANLSHADLRGAVISGNLNDVDLTMARLDKCNLAECNLQGANLKRAKLKETDFTGADLQNANLSKAHFDGTILNRVKLQGVDFKDVALTNAYVTGIALTVSQETGFLKSLQIRLLENE